MAVLYHRFRRYINNASWLLLEKVVSIGVSFLTTVIVARYLGVEGFGILAYATSMMSLFAVAGHMGLNGLVVRELVQNESLRAQILGTTLGLKVVSYLVGVFLLVIVNLAVGEQDYQEKLVSLVIAAALLFKPAEVIDFWFHSRIQARYSAIARMTGLLVSSLFKLILVYLGANLILFAFATLAQSVMAALIFFVLYVFTSTLKLSAWRFSYRGAKQLVSQGWMIFLGSIFTMVYLKVDQIMLRWITGSESVGVYAVASALSEAWYILPTVVVASIFPRLIKLREESYDRYHQRLQQIFDLLFLLALLIAVVVTVVSKPFITIFFGFEYQEAAPVLSIHIWAAIFIFMRAVFSKWILMENELMFSVVTQGCGAVMNVGLNFIFIPKYGPVGAALATLISYAAASYFALILSAKTRPVFWMMTRAMISPLKYGQLAASFILKNYMGNSKC